MKLILALVCALLAGCNTTPKVTIPVVVPVQETIDFGTLTDACPPLPKLTKADVANEKAFLLWFTMVTQSHDICQERLDSLVTVLRQGGLVK